MKETTEHKETFIYFLIYFVSFMVELSDDEDFELDMVRGASSRRRRLAVLNKCRLARGELDSLFLDDVPECFSDGFVSGSADIDLD